MIGRRIGWTVPSLAVRLRGWSACTATALVLAIAMPRSASAADDGDRMMARAMAACPGAASFVAAKDAKHGKARAPERSQPTPTVPALREALLAMSREDQAARSLPMDSPDTFKRMAAVDARNLPAMKSIVAEHGFPTVAMVGRDGFDAAWLLVQHADADPAFQKDMLSRLADGDVVSAEQIALLSDRVLRAQGKPQRYGSQFEQGRDGRMVPQPIEAPVDAIDARRATMGLMPLSDYACMINAMYALPAGAENAGPRQTAPAKRAPSPRH